ncbi:MAG: DNA methyltransferase family protein [Candidatus Saccharimonadales bacterium]
MGTTEHSINDAIAEILQTTRRAWLDSDIVRSENTGQIKGSTARPDILVLEPNVSPVVIETEVLPAATVEAEAVARLGAKLKQTGRTILSSVAVRLPLRLRGKSGKTLQKDLLASIDLEMALYTGSSPEKATRWPKSGWMIGTVADLSVLTQSATVPPDVIDAAATELVNGVSEVAGRLTEIAKGNSEAVEKIAKQLYQEDGEQTRRMAATILANAFVFHESLAGKLEGVNSIDELKGRKDFNKASVIAEWQKILLVNYWPIFDIARRILEIIPVAESKAVIEPLAETADRLLENRLMRSHDLTGAVFQRMIVDRKFLAAYYTTPASAALLIGLALVPDLTPAMKSWGDPENVTSLRIADFACGTGTLLTTAYSRIGQLHELAGGDSESIHARMMAHAIVGCDVLPSAAHLTASMIAGAHPTVKYQQSLIMTVPYGNMEGDLALGSLDLLNPKGKFPEMAITAKAAEGMGEKEKETWAALPHASFDLVVMNPPFTRPTNHEGNRRDVPNPMFAAFANTAQEQKMMAEATKRLTAGTSAHGNAGEASAFLLLAHRKLRDGGMVALVMPLSLMLGESWERSRALLTKNYSGLIVLTIAGSTDEESSFSADTDMAECLVVARKSMPQDNRATFVILKERPAYPLIGVSAADQIHRLIAKKNIRRLEDGPMGGTPLYSGNDVIGQAMDAPLPDSGGWNLERIADLSLAQAAYQLANEKRIWLPGMDKSEAVAVPITAVGTIGEVGPVHRDINGTNPNGSVRGPFQIEDLEGSSVPTYPVLWAHDAQREYTMCFEGDSEGLPLKSADAKEQGSIDKKINKIWGTASHCHCNLDFRFNSQSTAMQFTQRKTIGGRAWLSILLKSADLEKALVIWANSSLGLLLRWWRSNKQQSGRGNMGKSTLEIMPVLDVTALSPDQLGRAVKLFDSMCSKPMLPIHEIDKDLVRKELDERFASDLLGLPKTILQPDGPMDLLRKKLAREPSIRGNK